MIEQTAINNKPVKEDITRFGRLDKHIGPETIEAALTMLRERHSESGADKNENLRLTTLKVWKEAWESFPEDQTRNPAAGVQGVSGLH